MYIRNLARDDVPVLTAIYNHYVEHTTVSFETEPLTDAAFGTRAGGISEFFPYLVVTEDNGTVLGYAYLDRFAVRQAYRFTCDWSVYLDRNVRGRGIGRHLFGALTGIAREQGFCTMVGVVTEENAASRSFHERLGFRRAAQFDHIAFKMGKWLGVTYYTYPLLSTEEPPRELIPYRETSLFQKYQNSGERME